MVNVDLYSAIITKVSNALRGYHISPFYFVALLSLIHVFVIELIDQYKWFGLFSTVHSCFFLMCATNIYFLSYVLCLGLAL